jgi:hypothetical protein
LNPPITNVGLKDIPNQPNSPCRLHPVCHGSNGTTEASLLLLLLLLMLLVLHQV